MGKLFLNDKVATVNKLFTRGADDQNLLGLSPGDQL
jgi:hypothetical protein